MSDIVERLRAYAKDQGGWLNIDDTCEEAADTIQRLQAELSSLKASAKDARAEALEEAAKVAESHSDDKPSQCNTDWNDGYDDGCAGAASAIRALKEMP